MFKDPEEAPIEELWLAEEELWNKLEIVVVEEVVDEVFIWWSFEDEEDEDEEVLDDQLEDNPLPMAAIDSRTEENRGWSSGWRISNIDLLVNSLWRK